MPGPVSRNLDADAIALPPDSDQHAAFARVFDRIGDEVLQHALQQAAVGTDPQPCSARS